MESYENVNGIITEATLYLYQVHGTKKFSFGTWTSRQHVFAAIRADGMTGYGENIISVNQPDVSLEQWSARIKELTGRTVGDAIRYLRSNLGNWPDRLTEMAEMCLVDLWGKLVHRNALDLLGLSDRVPVNGVYVILSDDIDYVEERTRFAVSCGKTNYIKVKLFGDEELDVRVIRAVRKYLSPQDTYLIGDVNCGYRPRESRESVRELEDTLKRLYEAGLNACEDPGMLERDQWTALQDSVSPLSLIPDYPMRPARKAEKWIVKGMGDIYNIHPGCSASILDAVSLAKRIKSLGSGLMIGDDSLIGPACSIWQQLAVGLGADWVEAVEKEGESDFYYRSVIALPTDSRRNPIGLRTTESGFGICLDEEILRQAAHKVVKVTL